MSGLYRTLRGLAVGSSELSGAWFVTLGLYFTVTPAAANLRVTVSRIWVPTSPSYDPVSLGILSNHFFPSSLKAKAAFFDPYETLSTLHIRYICFPYPNDPASGLTAAFGTVCSPAGDMIIIQSQKRPRNNLCLRVQVECFDVSLAITA